MSEPIRLNNAERHQFFHNGLMLLSWCQSLGKVDEDRSKIDCILPRQFTERLLRVLGLQPNRALFEPDDYIPTPHAPAVCVFSHRSSLPLAVIAAFAIILRRRQRFRLEFGHCLKCGYDLRESKNNCPECGKAIPTAPTAAA